MSYQTVQSSAEMPAAPLDRTYGSVLASAGSVLMALGMMMMPPISIALPLKILMFILIDGWSLLLRALVNSFH